MGMQTFVLELWSQHITNSDPKHSSTVRLSSGAAATIAAAALPAAAQISYGGYTFHDETDNPVFRDYMR